MQKPGVRRSLLARELSDGTLRYEAAYITGTILDIDGGVSLR